MEVGDHVIPLYIPSVGTSTRRTMATAIIVLKRTSIRQTSAVRSALPRGKV